jgi:hypothetical protein
MEKPCFSFSDPYHTHMSTISKSPSILRVETLQIEETYPEQSFVRSSRSF